MLFGSWDHEGWSWFLVVMLFGSWDRESCSCWEWMGELKFINERVRDDNLFFFSFLGCSCDGFEFLDAGFDLRRTRCKMKNKLKNMKKFFDLCFFFFFFFFHLCCDLGLCLCLISVFLFYFFVCVVVIWVWVIGCWVYVLVIWVWVLVAGFDWEEQVVMFLWKLIMISNIFLKIKLDLRFFF